MQTNAESEGKPSEDNQVIQNNESSFDFNQITEKLNQHGDLLKRLAETPESVNAEGLKHLAEQTSKLSKFIDEFKISVETDNSNLKKQVEALMQDKYQKEFELEIGNVIKQYNFPPEVADLLKNVKMEELADYAASLAKVMENKTNIPAKLSVNNTNSKPTPSHLKHLL